MVRDFGRSLGLLEKRIVNPRPGEPRGVLAFVVTQQLVDQGKHS